MADRVSFMRRTFVSFALALAFMFSSSMIMEREVATASSAPVAQQISPEHQSISAQVFSVGQRSVEYRWYDLFNVPFGEWYDWRWEVYHNEQPLTDSYPFIYRYYRAPNTFDTYSLARLNIVGLNMPELNMTLRPELIPLLGTERGGNAVVDWTLQYLDQTDIDRLPYGVSAWYDGWMIGLRGNITLDRQAAKAVMGIDDSGFDDFSDWWSANSLEFRTDYLAWMLSEGNTRLDIYNMYEYPLTILYSNISASKYGESIVISPYIVSWGMEALMARWLHEAFLPVEPYFEDMHLYATIGPDSTDLYIDTAVAYALRAWSSLNNSEPCWVLEPRLGDYVYSTIPHPWCEFDPYAALGESTVPCRSPGSLEFGDLIDYDYTPAAWNLSENENLTVEWPRGEVLFLRHVSPGVTSNESAFAWVNYSAPNATDLPGSVICDSENRTISFIGPIDMWTWARDQTAHSNLFSRWDEIGLLPFGIPLIEFAKGPVPANLPPVAMFEIDTAGPIAMMPMIFNANQSRDGDEIPGPLWYRWDWECDGVYDTAWTDDVLQLHVFGQVGRLMVRLQVMDDAGLVDEYVGQVLVADQAPPVTTCHIVGTPLVNGWYTTPPTLEFTVQDFPGSSYTTFYKYNYDGWWRVWTGPVQVTSEGYLEISYYSVDSSNNNEFIKSIHINVDFSPPVIYNIHVDLVGMFGNTAKVSWYAIDNISAPSPVQLQLDDHEPVNAGYAHSHEFGGVSAGHHTITLTASDQAMHNATVVVEFEVEAISIDSPAGALAIAALVAAAVAVPMTLYLRRKTKAQKSP
ncbi:MAG TPA: hypothetical protein VGB78_12065 [Thermoplasmata archaeon]